MPVYVDNYKAPFRGMVMSHMGADSLNELEQMADTIGLSRSYRQKSTSGLVHYDVCQSKRALAIKNGAIELSATEMVRKLSPLFRD